MKIEISQVKMGALVIGGPLDGQIIDGEFNGVATGEHGEPFFYDSHYLGEGNMVWYPASIRSIDAPSLILKTLKLGCTFNHALLKANERICTLADTCANQEKRINGQKRLLAERANVNDALVNANHDLVAKIADLENTNRRLNDKLSHIRESGNKLRGNVDALVSAGNKLNDNNKKLREHIKELESLVSSGVRVDFDNSKPRARISELEEENAKLKAELLASGLARVHQVAQSGAHLSAMVSKVADHSRRVKTIEQEKNELVAILKELTDVLQKAWDERRLPADIISGELARKCRNTLENYVGLLWTELHLISSTCTVSYSTWLILTSALSNAHF